MNAVKLHFAIERQLPFATFFRFEGDGQFGMWHEARRDDPRAIAFFTENDVKKIVADLDGLLRVVGSPGPLPLTSGWAKHVAGAQIVATGIDDQGLPYIDIKCPKDGSDAASRAACSSLPDGPVASIPRGYAHAPKELWLQLHGDCSDDELDEPVDYESDDVTWCWHEINASDVRYVRADRAVSIPDGGAAEESPAEDALRSLACWLGVGGYNAPTVDAKVFEQKIRDGFACYSQRHGFAARDLAELVLSMGMVTDKGIRARDLARQVMGLAALAAPSAQPPVDATLDLRSNRNLTEGEDLCLTLEAWGHELAAKDDLHLKLIAGLLLRARAALAAPLKGQQP